MLFELEGAGQRNTVEMGDRISGFEIDLRLAQGRAGERVLGELGTVVGSVRRQVEIDPHPR
jgi:hypothetical protein